MQLVDHILVLMLFVLQPAYGYFETRYVESRERAGIPYERLREYHQTAAIEWLFFTFLIAIWYDFDRSFGALGLSLSLKPGFWASAVMCALLAVYLFSAWQAARRADAAGRAVYLESFGSMSRYLPHTNRELKTFFGLSLTAGIVEEVVYRGFVFWYLGQFMPLWVALIVSSTAFGLAHSYQGIAGSIRTGIVGLVFGGMYILSGSLWIPILAHVLVDVLQGAMAWEVLRSRSIPQAT